jgi:hypothetical protein
MMSVSHTQQILTLIEGSVNTHLMKIRRKQQEHNCEEPEGESPGTIF